MHHTTVLYSMVPTVVSYYKMLPCIEEKAEKKLHDLKKKVNKTCFVLISKCLLWLAVFSGGLNYLDGSALFAGSR